MTLSLSRRVLIAAGLCESLPQAIQFRSWLGLCQDASASVIIFTHSTQNDSHIDCACHPVPKHDYAGLFGQKACSIDTCSLTSRMLDRMTNRGHFHAARCLVAAGSTLSGLDHATDCRGVCLRPFEGDGTSADCGLIFRFSLPP